MTHDTEIRTLAPTMQYRHAWLYLDFETWYELDWLAPDGIGPVPMGYYKACTCGWADPTTHKTIQEAEAAFHDL